MTMTKLFRLLSARLGEGIKVLLPLAQLAQFDLERGSQFVAAALIDQGLEWLRQSVFGV